MMNQLFDRVGVRYEVALDILGAVIAHHAEGIAAERGKAAPDEVVIEAMKVEVDNFRSIRDELNPRDSDEVERVIEQYGPQARALYK
jgi:hypothetical protein